MEQKKKTKHPAQKRPRSEKARQEVLEDIETKRHGDGRFQSVLLFTAAVLFFLLAFVQGSAGWYFLHRAVRGIFGFSICFVPLLLLAFAYFTGRRGSMTFGRHLLIGALLTILLSTFIQVIFAGDIEKKDFFRAVAYVYETAAENAFRSGGVVSVILAFPLIYGLGVTGSRIVVAVALFVAVMWMFDLSLGQLFSAITYPFRKLKEIWQYRPEEPQSEELEEETPPTPKEQKKASLPKKPHTGPIHLFIEWIMGGEPPEEEEEDIYENPAEEDAGEALPDFEAMMRTNGAPQRSSYDMDIDIPIEPSPQKASDRGFDIDIPTETASPASQETAPDYDIDIPLQAESSAQSSAIDIPAETAQKPAKQKEPSPSQPYSPPPLDFLLPGQSCAKDPAAQRELQENGATLVETLNSFGVTVRITGIARGPSVTRYEIQPAAGVKVSKITSLSDDIALSLATQGVRIEAPVPGKPAIGIEVPNGARDTVSLREILENARFQKSKSRLSFCVGKDIAGNPVIGDIAKLPHMIIAGATGSGKSVCTNAIIMSLLYHAAPEEVKLILIDPKIVEFTVYEGIPHLLIPVVTDPKKAAGALNWAVGEMQRRYNLFADNLVRDIGDYNALFPDDPMAQIVIIIDELADLMMTTSKEVEDAICRLAQKARAAGMHLIIATQRPTTDIITGLIKANIPSRIALSVMSAVDSRTILDTGGAEKLLGHGDMLYLPNGLPKPLRVQGCFVSTKEIERAVGFIKEQSESRYSDEIIEQVEKSIPLTKAEQKAAAASGATTAPPPAPTPSQPEPPSGDMGSDEEILERAIEFVVEAKTASTSSLQRRLKLGYARAARIMDELEELGVIGPYEGAKPRRVLMTKEQLQERKIRRLR